MAKRIVYLEPVNCFMQSGEVKLEFLGPLSDEEMATVIERANRVGYTHESSLVPYRPGVERIRLNDPTGEGYHRDYLATFE